MPENSSDSMTVSQAAGTIPRTIEKRLERITGLARNGNIPDALTEAAKLAIHHTDRTEPAQLALDLAFDIQKTEGLQAISKMLSTQKPDSLAAAYAACYVQFRTQQPELARNAAEEIHKQHPKDLNVAFLLASICRAQADTAHEIACLGSMLPHHPNAARLHQRLAYLMTLASQFEKAAQFSQRAWNLGLKSGSSAEMLATLLNLLNRSDEAIPILEEALAAEPERYNVIVLLAIARSRAGDTAAATAGIDRALKLQPFTVRGPEDGQDVGLTTLVVERSDLKFFDRPHFAKYNFSNFPTYITAPDLRRVYAPLAQWTYKHLEEADIRPDVVLNNVVISELIDERARGFYDALEASYFQAGVPVVNPMEAVFQCGREANSHKFKNESAFTFPRTRHVVMATMPIDRLVAEVEADFDWPVLLRPTATQVSKGMRLIDGPDELREAIGEMDLSEYYVIQYHECRDEKGVGRQFRAVVIGDELSVDRINAHFGFQSHEKLRQDASWQEHGFDREEQSFVADPDGFWDLP